MNSLVETVEGYDMMFSRRAVAANIRSERSWFQLLPQISCPVLLVRASGHEAVSDDDLARMRSMIGNFRSRDMSEPDHNVHLSNKAEFYACFDSFLSEIQPRPTV